MISTILIHVHGVFLFLCAATVGVICLVLVLNKDYEDGLIGRVALASLALAAYVRCSVIVDRDFIATFSPIATLTWPALALFFGRHIYRFYRWRDCGEHEWREPSRSGLTGK